MTQNYLSNENIDDIQMILTASFNKKDDPFNLKAIIAEWLKTANDVFNDLQRNDDYSLNLAKQKLINFLPILKKYLTLSNNARHNIVNSYVTFLSKAFPLITFNNHKELAFIKFKRVFRLENAIKYLHIFYELNKIRQYTNLGLIVNVTDIKQTIMKNQSLLNKSILFDFDKNDYQYINTIYNMDVYGKK